MVPNIYQKNMIKFTEVTFDLQMGNRPNFWGALSITYSIS